MTHYKPGIPTIACRLDLEIGAIFIGAVFYLFHAALMDVYWKRMYVFDLIRWRRRSCY